MLRECDAVVAEDTRRTRQLLTAHGISRPLLSLPAHDEARRVPALVARLVARRVAGAVHRRGHPGGQRPRSGAGPRAPARPG